MAARSHSVSNGGGGLAKIIFAILFVGAVALGVARLSKWFNEEYIVGALEDAAPGQLDQAEGLLAEGKPDEVRALLRPLVERVNHPVLTPQALMLLARAEEASGNDTEAASLLERAINEYGDSAEAPRARIAYGRLLEKLGRSSDAVVVYESVRVNAPGELRAAAVTGLARHAEASGEVLGARDLYRQAVSEAAWGSAEWDEALDGLGRTNVALIFGRGETPESKYYTIAKGDTLTSIGVKLNTTQGLLTRANGIADPGRLSLGQRLKHTPKDFRIVIEEGACRLFLVDGEGIFKRYRVGLGQTGHRTTPGQYKIAVKQKDPTWYKPGGGVIPSGDPENELGTRWMSFEPEAEGLPTGLGLHGTTHPETVGEYSSQGCARLLQEDVEELYDLVVRATPVSVVETVDPSALGFGL